MILSFTYINLLKLWRYIWSKPEPTQFKHDVTIKLILQTTPEPSETSTDTRAGVTNC